VVWVCAILVGGYFLIWYADKGMERLRKIHYHRSTVNSYLIYMNDDQLLQAESKSSGKSPDEIRAWYAEAIEYHTVMVRKWERATLFTRPFDPGRPPGP
jgi:hypothetical protein